MILYDKARNITVDKGNNQQLLSEALASSITSYEMLGKGAFSSERENLANICIEHINNASREVSSKRTRISFRPWCKNCLNRSAK